MPPPPEDLWRAQVQREMENLGLMLRAAHHENEQLKQQLRLAKECEARSGFATPADSIQELQRKIIDDGRDTKDGVEVVRSGAPDLPLLAEWSAAEGPIAMGDWLTTLGPAIADLSETSEEWREALMDEVQK